MLAVAERMFLEQGYAPVAMSGIAEQSGVSRDLLYKAFGSKAALLKRLYDVTRAGDDDPIPIADRPVLTDLAALSPPDRVAELARIHRDLFARVGSLLIMVVAGAMAGDPDLVEPGTVIEHERLVGTRAIVAGFATPGDAIEAIVDEVWLLFSPEIWELLTRRRGWSAERYEGWLARALTVALDVR